MMPTIEPFLQYGALGVICFVFITVAYNLFNKQSKQFELLITNLVTQKNDSFDDLKDLLAALLQTLNNQNAHITQSFNEITNRLGIGITDRHDMLELFIKQDELSSKRYIEFISQLTEYKMVLYKMRTDCYCIANKKKIGAILVEKGYITQAQLDETLREL